MTTNKKIYHAAYVLRPEVKERARIRDTRRRRKNGVIEMSTEQRRASALFNLKNKEAIKKHKDAVSSMGEKHHCALIWSLKDPSGTIHRFRNLCLFVREHHNLFTEAQLTMNWKGLPNAIGTLSKLSPRKKHPSETAYGWRWHIGHGVQDEGLLLSDQKNNEP